MTRIQKPNWMPWHAERERYAHRPTQGFLNDLNALQSHISNLHRLAPKERDGRLHANALTYLTKLRQSLHQAKTFTSTPLSLYQSPSDQNLADLNLELDLQHLGEPHL